MTLLEYLTANPPVLAAASTILGGIALKMVENWLGKRIEQRNDRKDYREEIRELHERIDELEEDLSQWRTRAFTAEEQVALLRIVVISLGGELPEQTVKSAQ